MTNLNKTKILLILASFLCATVTPVLADGHEGGEGHDGPPPMLVLMPPPDTEEPEGVEISENPEEAFGQIADIFFDMMDTDGNGELNRDELMAWLAPPPMHDEGMGHDKGGEMHGEGMDMEEMRRQIEDEIRHQIHMEMREEHLMHMRHEIEEMRNHEQHMRDEMQEMQRHRDEVQQELTRIREEIGRMEEEVQRMEEEGPEGHEGG